MEITEIRVVLEEGDENAKLKATVNIAIDNCLMIRGLKVIKGIRGLFVAMPCKKGKSDVFRDVVHPLNTETRKMIEQQVLAAYEQKLTEEKA